MSRRVTRLAPSPTGALHLGNARTFLITWAIARQRGWRMPLRIEDMDGPRVRSDSADHTIEILDWLGLNWDDEVIHQSHDLAPYRAALNGLLAAHRSFSCDLSRTEIEQAASAPHRGEGETRFPPELRPDDLARWQPGQEDTNYRFVVPDQDVPIVDHVKGDSKTNPFREVGDFVIWTRRGTPSYQLAVVVDDAAQGVTDVIRGEDLLPSAGRQMLLYQALGLPAPKWWHLPLVVGEDGRRLAKRHGDTRIESYRREGVSAARIVGLLAWWSGVTSDRGEMTADDFLTAFAVDTLPRNSITFGEDDHSWLLGG